MTYLETGVFRLSTVSPIHIRAGDPDVYGQGFIRLKSSDDFLYVVDIPKLQAEIFAFNGLVAVEIYTKAYSNPKSKTNITTVLKKIGYDYKSNITKISKGIVRLPGGHRFIRSGLGKHIVPGSSIKGAIKTAVLFHFAERVLTQHPTSLDTFVTNKIDWYRNEPSNDKKQSFAETLLKQTFESRHPLEHFPNEQRTEEPNGPFTDIFRAIKVKDAMIEKSLDVQCKDILFTTLDSSNRFDEKTRVRDVECFNGETEIEISIDHDILKSFTRAGAQPPFNNLSSLIQLCQNFSQAQWEEEQQFLNDYGNGGSINLDDIKKFYNDPENEKCATLRVGWGTGMLGTTISLLLGEDTRVRLRNKVISYDGEERFKPAPKSRRFVWDNTQPKYPLGWIELKE